MEHYVYILYSAKLDKYYTGATSETEMRMKLHLNSAKEKFTHRADDWIMIYQMECSTKGTALAIEKHIKTMKSKTYIQNLIKYPEMEEKLKAKYNL